METLKQIGVGLAVIVVVCAGMWWVTMGPEVKGMANRQAEARGWQPVFAEPEQPDELQWSSRWSLIWQSAR